MSAQQPERIPPSGPPYLLPVAQSGGIPSPFPDDIICGIFLALFGAGAATHMTIFQINRIREHKFLFSALLFGFCMARITSLVMRIVLSNNQTNASIAIAANIFVLAGVLLLFIVNLLFAQRIVRAYHPAFGWSKPVTWGFRFLLFSLVALLIMTITTTVHSYFTLDAQIRQKERNVALFAGTYLALLAFLPIPIVIASVLVPRQHRIDKFGTGRFRTKVRLLLFTSTLLTIGAGFRIGVNFSPRPVTNPAWYHHKAAFYVMNFGIELIVVFVYAAARFDTRFHIPNGSSKQQNYQGFNTESEVFGDGERKESDPSSSGSASRDNGHSSYELNLRIPNYRLRAPESQEPLAAWVPRPEAAHGMAPNYRLRAPESSDSLASWAPKPEPVNEIVPNYRRSLRAPESKDSLAAWSPKPEVASEIV